MIPKVPKKPAFFQRLIGGLIIFEALAFGGAYFGWSKLNNNRDFRERAKESAPWVLDLYYKMGEMMSDKNKVIRETDETIWAYNAAKKDKEN